MAAAVAFFTRLEHEFNLTACKVIFVVHQQLGGASSMEVWVSWPQVWADLATWLEKASPESSSMGRASMSARSRRVLARLSAVQDGDNAAAALLGARTPFFSIPR